MSSADTVFIDGIRSSSRRIVRALGFMRPNLARTDYPPSAVHAILELGLRQSMTASEIAEYLGLEKSSVSRLLRNLIDVGVLQEKSNEHDGRSKNLSLTSKGRRTFAAITAFGRDQVGSALQKLSKKQQQLVSIGLAIYADALSQASQNLSSAIGDITIERGYRPGAVGRITEMHAVFYSQHAGFGCFFENKVANGLSTFVSLLKNPRNQLWLAIQRGRIVGSIAIEGADAKRKGAHLRWFIVDEGIRGHGVGQDLLTQALEFCDRENFKETYLWTFDSLHSARHLYESRGFNLAEERIGSTWGKQVLEQRFVRQKFSTKGESHLAS